MPAFFISVIFPIFVVHLKTIIQFMKFFSIKKLYYTLFFVIGLSLAFSFIRVNTSVSSGIEPVKKTGGDDDKPAEEVYKNIQSLKGMPAGELGNVMQFIRASLNVNCAFCHVHNETDHTWDWASDSIEAKRVTREMITMVKEINTSHFNGNNAVTCFTCHNGSEHPMRTPPLPQHMAQQEENEHPEKVMEADQLFSNFDKAVNGNKPGDLKTKYSKGTITGADGKSYPVEIWQQAPDKYLQVTEMPEGKVYKGFDGVNGWIKNSKGVQDLKGMQLGILKKFADFYGDMNLAVNFPDSRFIGTDTANGFNCYVIRSIMDDKRSARLYFDVENLMLVRKNLYTKSFLGNIPERVDYVEYSGSGLKYPSKINYSYLDPWSESSRTFSEVKYNISLDGISFTAPTN